MKLFKAKSRKSTGGAPYITLPRNAKLEGNSEEFDIMKFHPRSDEDSHVLKARVLIDGITDHIYNPIRLISSEKYWFAYVTDIWSAVVYDIPTSGSLDTFRIKVLAGGNDITNECYLLDEWYDEYSEQTVSIENNYDDDTLPLYSSYMVIAIPMSYTNTGSSSINIYLKGYIYNGQQISKGGVFDNVKNAPLIDLFTGMVKHYNLSSDIPIPKSFLLIHTNGGIQIRSTITNAGVGWKIRPLLYTQEQIETGKVKWTGVNICPDGYILTEDYDHTTGPNNDGVLSIQSDSTTYYYYDVGYTPENY